MTINERDADRILRSWFQEGTAPLPDRVLDTVLDGIPHIPQRRRAWPSVRVSPQQLTWLRLGLVAAVLVALFAGFLLAGGAQWLAPPKAFPGEGTRLAAGRYVIDAPFPIRFGIAVPDGWIAADLSSVVALDREGPDPSAGLWIGTAEAVYVDPCHPELGLRGVAGPSIDELAGALTTIPGVIPSPVEHVAIGGRTAALVTLQAPSSFAGCTPHEPEFPIWDLPEPYGLRAGFRHRVWIFQADARRLVIAAADPGPGSDAARDIDFILKSLNFTAEAVPQPTDDANVAVPTESPIPVLPASGPLAPGVYLLRIPIYTIFGDELTREPGFHDAVFEAPAGWFPTSRGLVAEVDAPDAATFEIWTVARLAIDPCHWRSDAWDNAGDWRGTEGVSALLSAWWPPTLHPDLVAEGNEPAAFAPLASDPVLHPWLSAESYRLVLQIPGELDLDTCDDGTYVIWTDPSGEGRTAQPGERIEVWVEAVGSSVVVVAGGVPPGASPAAAQMIDAVLNSTTVLQAGG